MDSFVKSLSLVSQEEIENTLMAECKHLKHAHHMMGQNSPGCSLTELIVLDKGKYVLVEISSLKILGFA